MNKTAQIPLRIEPELKAKLIELAKKDKRSLNNYCEIIFEKHIEEKAKNQVTNQI